MGRRLGHGLASLEARYDAVVVGTGYGGGVAACRLARAGLRVAILERGSELRPGDFPDTVRAVGLDTQVHRRGRRSFGRAAALFDWRVSDDVVTLVGCGVGGTSLINANVALEAAPEIFDDTAWPAALRGDDLGRRAAYAAAQSMLQPTPWPEERRGEPPKLATLRRAARSVGATTRRVPLSVGFDVGVDPAGRARAACTGCGDCVTGCNVGAKHSVDQTYVADAVAHGAHLVVEATVHHVARAGDGWRVHVLPTGAMGPVVTVEAERVVLAAGALGSTEILTRSRREGLWVSPTLGWSLSGNGDDLSFAYDGDHRVHGVGRGAEVDPADPVGTTITGGFDDEIDRPGGGTSRVLFEEGVLPKAMARLAAVGLFSLWRRQRPDRPRGRPRWWRKLLSLVHGPSHGPVDRSLVVLGMGFDDDRGRAVVPRQARRHAVIAWPGAGSSPDQRATDAAAERLARALDTGPLRSPVAGHAITVHPLGGCVMADSGDAGVVDHLGRVWAGRGTQVHDGLHVLDGSVIPVPLGVNPSLTIAALAERAMAVLVGPSTARGRPSPAQQADPPAGVTPGVMLRVRLRGSATLVGDRTEVPVDMHLIVGFDDLAALERDPGTPGHVRGTVRVAGAGMGLMTVESGTSVLADAGATDDGSGMRYDLVCRGADGLRYRVAGTDRMHGRPVFDPWRAAIRCGVTVSRMDVRPPGPVATGSVRLGPVGLVRTAVSTRPVGSPPGPRGSVEAMVGFAHVLRRARTSSGRPDRSR